jgi:hypothetical protein
VVQVEHLQSQGLQFYTLVVAVAVDQFHGQAETMGVLEVVDAQRRQAVRI